MRGLRTHTKQEPINLQIFLHYVQSKAIALHQRSAVQGKDNRKTQREATQHNAAQSSAKHRKLAQHSGKMAKLSNTPCVISLSPHIEVTTRRILKRLTLKSSAINLIWASNPSKSRGANRSP
jgi:hypothetical protein